MQKELFPRDKRLEAVFAGITLLVLAADQLTKAWIRATLDVGESFLDVGFFEIVHVQNTGAAFGMFKGFPYIFAAVQGIAILAILFMVIFMRRRWTFIDNTILRCGLALVLAGSAGNFIDRILFEGRVTDFLNFKVWPVFNVADSATVVGGILIAWAVIFLFKPEKQE